MHLTNVAIQKTSDEYSQRIGGKWYLQTLKLYLISKYYNLYLIGLVKKKLVRLFMKYNKLF